MYLPWSNLLMATCEKNMRHKIQKSNVFGEWCEGTYLLLQGSRGTQAICGHGPGPLSLKYSVQTHTHTSKNMLEKEGGGGKWGCTFVNACQSILNLEKKHKTLLASERFVKDRFMY